MTKIKLCNIWVFLLAICLIAPAAMAQRNTAELQADGWVLWEWPSDPLSVPPDTVTTVDYAWNAAVDGVLTDGNPTDTQQALYLGDQNRGWYRFADTPLFGELSFLVYDKGTSAIHAHSTYGPRWGVQNNPAPNPVPAGGTPNDQLMSVEIIAKSYIDANTSYSFINSTAGEVANTSSHFTLTWPGSFDPAPGEVGGGAPRRTAGTLPPDVAAYDPADNVQGAWARWSFTVHDGDDMIFKVTDADGVSNPQAWVVIPTLDSIFDTGFSTTGFNQVFFYGGNTAGNGTTDHIGLWIDDVVFTPDAGQGASAWSEDFNDPTGGPSLCAIRGSEGDFNCDTEIGLLDLDILGQNWGATGLVPPPPTYELGDANGDGEVGLLDLDVLGQNWGLGTSVPEPAALGLLVIGSILAMRRL